MGNLQRSTVVAGITVGTTVGDSMAIPYSNYAGGSVFIPSDSSITVLTWYGSYDGVTYLAVQDGFSNPVLSNVGASVCCLIPAACYAMRFVKATDPIGGVINVSLKS